MNRWMWKLGAGIGLVLSMFNVSSSPAEAHHETTMVVDAANPVEVRTDGQSIVWSRSGDEVFREVFLTDIDSGETLYLTHGDIPAFDVSGDRVVWLDRQRNEIWRFEISTGETELLAHNIAMSAHQRPLNVDGDWAVWVEVDEETRIIARNLVSGERIVVDRADSISFRSGYVPSIGSPVLNGAQVYWQARRGTEPEDLLVRNLETGQQEVVMKIEQSLYDIAGDILITLDGRFLTVHDLDSGESQQVTSQARQAAVDAAGMVFWEERESSGPHNLQSLHAWDNERGEELELRLGYVSVPVSMSFTAEHGMLVWSGIHAVEIDSLRDGSLWRYFPETDRHVRFGLLDYWSNNGGIRVFGYPVTDQFENAQFFERQRIEEHPQHLGTPYDVQLGLLGVEDADTRGLPETPPFQPLPADTSSNEHCRFFPETGHRLCHGFQDYWTSHGLDFGDSGVSYRESLALFGYPISEEYVDPQTGLVTQYFERARFEFHPDNPDPYRILLGRLGADLVEREQFPGFWPRD